MYPGRPWTIRQYAGFSTAEESNEFFHTALDGGQRGLSVAFDLPTHRGYDSDADEAIADVGMAGVAIDSVEDMKILFDGIPLDKMSVSMTMNGAVLPVLASFIVAGREQGVAPNALSGTIQNDILKEFMVRNTYIYPPAPSMRIVSDIISYTADQMPKFNSVSISGYHIHEAGATLVQELAFTLADGLEYVRAAMARGLDVDDFAPRLSFFFAIGTNLFLEAAKLRAARVLWAELMAEQFAPADPRSLALRTHCQTSGVSLAAQDPHNNIVRTAYEALAAVLGGTQSLHTNAFDEALALPSDDAARIARNTQLILQHETGVTDVIDPLAGSYYVENLTASFVAEARKIIDEIAAMGGMTRAIEDGWPSAQIEAAAARRQARIERGETVVVGVNGYRAAKEEPIEIRAVDNGAVRARQIARLAETRADRDPALVEQALGDLSRAAREDSGNLLSLSIDAMAVRATLGEVSGELAKIFGRHEARPQLISGVYAAGYEGDEGFRVLCSDVARFATDEGGPPRFLVAKLGQDGHDRGAKIVASAFKDLGFAVDVGPLFDTPTALAKRAAAAGAHAIGISSLAGAHKTFVPALARALKEEGAENIVIVCGGVIPVGDHEYLQAEGAAAIFGPGTDICAAAGEVLALIRASVHRNQ
jgi:methylmalonyl-CoA mutase